MPDVDVFELRFAAAYRRYLDEADTAVDAAAVARSVASGARHRRAGARGWPVRAVPAGAWVVVLVALLVAAVAAAWLIGKPEPILQVAPVTSDGPSPVPSGWVWLTGTWSQPSGWKAVLALHPCGPGEVCGRFELNLDGGGGSRCVYTLQHRPPDGVAYVYWTVGTNELGGSEGDRFHCGYDWGLRELRVEAQSAGSVLVWSEVDGVERARWPLSLISDQYEPQLPPTIAGDWSYTNGQPAKVLHLTPCGPGESCGNLTLLRPDSECSYTLQYRPRAYEAFVFLVSSASSAQCDIREWSQATLQVRPSAVGQVVVSRDPSPQFPGLQFTLYEPGFEPGSSPGASPDG